MSGRDSALGALYGLAIGDALGMPTQLMSRAAIAERYGTLHTFEPADDDHPLAAGMAAASITDDTEQALLVARLLVEGAEAEEHHGPEVGGVAVVGVELEGALHVVERLAQAAVLEGVGREVLLGDGALLVAGGGPRVDAAAQRDRDAEHGTAEESAPSRLPNLCRAVASVGHTLPLGVLR